MRKIEKLLALDNYEQMRIELCRYSLSSRSFSIQAINEFVSSSLVMMKLWRILMRVSCPLFV